MMFLDSDRNHKPPKRCVTLTRLCAAVLVLACGMVPAAKCTQRQERGEWRKPVPPKAIRVSGGDPLPGYASTYVSVYGSDSNDGLGWGTAKRTIAGALAACASYGIGCHINVAPGVYTFSSTIQLPLGVNMAHCTIEGMAWGGTGGTTLNDAGLTVFDLASGTGPIFDQTETNSGYQNTVGCTLKNLVIEDDPSNPSTNVILVKFGGTMGQRFEHVSFIGNGSSGEVCLQAFNAPGMYTERAEYDIWINNCSSGVKLVGTGTSWDFGHMSPSKFYLNEFAKQRGIEYSDASTYDSMYSLLGNISVTSGNSASAIYIDDNRSSMNRDRINFLVEGNCPQTLRSGSYDVWPS